MLFRSGGSCAESLGEVASGVPRCMASSSQSLFINAGPGATAVLRSRGAGVGPRVDGGPRVPDRQMVIGSLDWTRRGGCTGRWEPGSPRTEGAAISVHGPVRALSHRDRPLGHEWPAHKQRRSWCAGMAGACPKKCRCHNQTLGVPPPARPVWSRLSRTHRPAESSGKIGRAHV